MKKLLREREKLKTIRHGKVRSIAMLFAENLAHLLIISDNREQRVDSWRNFASSSKKKKKTKTVILG